MMNAMVGFVLHNLDRGFPLLLSTQLDRGIFPSFMTQTIASSRDG